MSQLYLKGKTQAQIGMELGLTPGTVTADLKHARTLWLKETALAFDERKAQEVARLDRVEEQAWHGWERSVETQTVYHKRSKAQRQAVRGPSAGHNKPGAVVGHKMVPIEEVSETVVRGQSGDPRFLEIIQSCVEMRLRVLGLWKESVAGQGATLVIDWPALFEAQAQRARRSEALHGAALGLPGAGTVREVYEADRPTARPDLTGGEVPTKGLPPEPEDPVEAKIRAYERRASVMTEDDYGGKVGG